MKPGCPDDYSITINSDDLYKVDNILKDLENWPGEVLTSHKSASHLIHKLVFIADIGFTTDDERIQNIVDKILRYKSKEGLYQVKVNIPRHFGGTGEDQFAWALCDAPLIMYSLCKFNVNYDEHLKKGIDFLFQISRENGWPCKCSEELGKFRGPGKKEDPCPYATLIMIKLASVTNGYKNADSTKKGINAILNCWENSNEIHPYMFFMGKDFRKLKLPFVWYDILNVVEVLSRFDFVKTDKRFSEMVDIIQEKRNENGEYIPESIWKSWSEWDFGQKKESSKYMKQIINKILYRLDES